MRTNEEPAVTWQQPPRPTKLSDPYHDNFEEELRSLLATRDADLEWHHFRLLFGPPEAGTFDELAYFLPATFQHVRSDDPNVGEYINGLVYWLSTHHEDLSRIDGDAYVREQLRKTLDHWTRSFRVDHYDQAACRAKGWTLAYCDHVQLTDYVSELIHELVRMDTYADVAEAFIADMARSESSTAAAWFLEYARGQAGDPFYPVSGVPMSAEEEAEWIQSFKKTYAEMGMPADEDEVESMLAAERDQRAVKSEAITKLVRDQALRLRALDRVKSSDLYDPEATYWRDTLQVLGLEP